MSNGRIDDADLELALSGGRAELDRYLAVGIRELRDAVEALQRTCAERGKTCPAVVSARTVSSLVRVTANKLVVPVLAALLTAAAMKILV